MGGIFGIERRLPLCHRFNKCVGRHKTTGAKTLVQTARSVLFGPAKLVHGATGPEAITHPPPYYNRNLIRHHPHPAVSQHAASSCVRFCQSRSISLPPPFPSPPHHHAFPQRCPPQLQTAHHHCPLFIAGRRRLGSGAQDGADRMAGNQHPRLCPLGIHPFPRKGQP